MHTRRNNSGINENDILARLRNTVSDSEWYFARIAWMIFDDNFDGVHPKERFCKIVDLLESRYPTVSNWPADLVTIYYIREWCLVTINDRKRNQTLFDIHERLLSIWIELHNLDNQLNYYEQHVRDIDRKFSYPTIFEGRRWEPA